MKYRTRKGTSFEREPADWLRLLVMLFLVTLPFVLSFSGLEKFRLPKDAFSAAVIPLLAAVYLTFQRLRLRFELGTWESILGIATLYMGLHIFWSVRPEFSLPAFLSLALMFGFVLILIPVLTFDFQLKLWQWIGLAFGVNAVMTVLQHLGHFPIMFRDTGEQIRGRLNAAGFVGDVNSGGFLFGLISILLLYGAILGPSARFRWNSIVLLVVNLVGLAFTVTLTAIISLGVCFLLWAFFHAWWLRRFRRSPNQRPGRILLVILLAMTGLILVALFSGLGDRLAEVGRTWGEGDLMTATAGRTPVYYLTWNLIQESPLVGKGLGTFGSEFFTFRVGTDTGQSVTLVDEPGAFQQAHNEYLQTWFELGLVGLGFLLLLVVWPLVTAVRMHRRLANPNQVYWMGLLCLAVVFVLLSSLAFFPFRLTVTGAYVAVLFAGLRSLQRSEPETAWELEKGEAKSLGHTLKVGLLFLAVLILVVLQYGHWMANVEAGRAALLLERAASAETPVRQQRVWAAEALELLESASGRSGRIPELYNLKGSAFLLLGRPAEAESQFALATFYQPSPETFTNRAAACLVLGEHDRAENYLLIALRYNPNTSKAKEALAFLRMSRSLSSQ